MIGAPPQENKTRKDEDPIKLSNGGGDSAPQTSTNSGESNDSSGFAFLCICRRHLGLEIASNLEQHCFLLPPPPLMPVHPCSNAGSPILNADISQRRRPTHSKCQHWAPANQNNQPFAPPPSALNNPLSLLSFGLEPWHTRAREVRGEGKDGGGGDERDECPTTALTKFVALALPANRSNNQPMMVAASGSGRTRWAMDGKVREREE